MDPLFHFNSVLCSFCFDVAGWQSICIFTPVSVLRWSCGLVPSSLHPSIPLLTVSLSVSRLKLASLPLSGELICLVPWLSLLALINRRVTLPLQRQRLKLSFFSLNYLESQWGARSSQPHTSCKILQLTATSLLGLFSFFLSKLGMFVLVAGSGAGGAVSVCCDGKLRAELPLMAVAERSEGWFYGWSRVFFLRFKGLSERPVSVHCCIHRLVVFPSFDSGSVYLRGDKTAEWLKWCDKNSEYKNAAAVDVYVTIESIRGRQIY